MEYKYQGVIFSKIDVGEVDRIYSIYTLEAGIIRVLAKGVRKPNAKLAGNLEPITYLEIFVVKNKGMGKIIGAIPLNNFSQIKENIVSLENIFYVFNIFNQLITQEEQDAQVFNFLIVFLISLDELTLSGKNEIKITIFTVGFLFKLLSALGYELQMQECVNCLQKITPRENYFNSAKGGIICPKCSVREIRKIKINDETIKLIRIFLNNKIENFGKLKVEPNILNNLKIILNDYLHWINN